MAEARMFYQEDCNLSLLDGKTIAVIGYGSQGHAHALNAKESGCNVIIGLYEGSKSWAKAEKQGFEVYTAAEAAKRADIIMILINDELQADMYKKDIEPNLEPGNMLMFAHGFNIHFGCIVPPKDVDVTMVAPKGPGHTVRSEYQAGKGVPCLVAVQQDATGRALDLALAMLEAIGGGAAGSWQIANMAPRVLAGDFAPGFFIKHFIKDMKIIQDESTQRGVELPMLDTVCSLYEELARRGLENEGTQALIRYYEPEA